MCEAADVVVCLAVVFAGRGCIGLVIAKIALHARANTQDSAFPDGSSAGWTDSVLAWLIPHRAPRDMRGIGSARRSRQGPVGQDLPGWRVAVVAVCTTVGSPWVGSNPTPGTI